MITQIYEIQTPAEAEAMIDLGVNHIGSVVVSKETWRQPLIRETIELVSGSTAKSSLILLYDDPDRISFSLDYYRPDIVHFCETIIDPPDRWEAGCGRLISIQATVRERFPEIAIMRSIPIPPAGSENPVPMMELARYFEPLSDFFLTDTLLVGTQGPCNADQPVNGYVGITGKTCDWDLAAQLVKESYIPVILAGGLSPDNVYEAIGAVLPAGVDSCTMTNAVDIRGRPIRFKKDPEKVGRFISEARRASADLAVS